MKRLAQPPAEGVKMRKVTNFLKHKKGRLGSVTRSTSKKRGNKSEDPTTQNNRELASALSKARSRIGDLESEKLCLQGERQELIEQVFTKNSELKKCKNQDDARKYESAHFIKENSATLKSKLHEAIEKLMESSDLLSDAVQRADLLFQMAYCEIGGNTSNCNRSLDITRTPLRIICKDVHQMSHEADAALSITTMTPSSSSSSDIEVATSPAVDVTPDTLFRHGDIDSLIGVMDVDSPTLSPSRDLPLSCSTPYLKPGRKVGTAVGILAMAPEAFEGSPDTSQTSINIPHVPSGGSSAVRRRISRRRVVRANFSGYKEPLLNSKLRQGDPHTDCSLFPPKSIRPDARRISLKRKNKHAGNNNLTRKIRRNGKKVRNTCSDVDEEMNTD